jgi:hypothetical protein
MPVEMGASLVLKIILKVCLLDIVANLIINGENSIIFMSKAGGYQREFPSLTLHKVRLG